jgi:hypothetical protein
MSFFFISFRCSSNSSSIPFVSFQRAEKKIAEQIHTHVCMFRCPHLLTVVSCLIFFKVSCLLAKQNRRDECKRGNLPSPVHTNRDTAQPSSKWWSRLEEERKSPDVGPKRKMPSNKFAHRTRKQHFSLISSQKTFLYLTLSKKAFICLIQFLPS